jgi:hypothetical protein
MSVELAAAMDTAVDSAADSAVDRAVHPIGWPEAARPLAEQLQRQLAIEARDWHRLKHQRPRRAAEQLAAALVHLLSADNPQQRQPTAAREQAIALTEHALAWLKAELNDPGCPSHGR